jgi:hypothetical protein
LSDIESAGNPVCAVYWPKPEAELWGGKYGNAKVHKGEPLAVLSSGEKVPL